MKQGQGPRMMVKVVLLLMGAAALGMFPTLGLAQVLDNDKDGFADTYEGTTLSTIDDPTGQLPQFRFTLDRFKMDLFVILRTATSPASLIPASDPLQYMVHPALSVHRIPRDPANSSRLVFPNTISKQYAVRLTEESLKTLATGQILGICTYGIPNYYDDATIYTQRIKEWVEQKSAGATQVCMGTSTGATTCGAPNEPLVQSIRETYIKHTIAHEAGHMMKLTRTYVSSYGGYHTATGNGQLMDQSVYYTNKNGTVTWYIPTQYNANVTPVLIK